MEHMSDNIKQSMNLPAELHVDQGRKHFLLEHQQCKSRHQVSHPKCQGIEER